MSYSDLKELFKDARNIATGANDVQLKSLLLDIQNEVFDLQEENKELRNKLIDFKNDKLLENGLVYRQGVYTKDTEEVTFCSVCWDKYKELSRVRKMKETTDGHTVFVCDVCNEWRFSDIIWKD